jgi:hypothetical protein
VVVVIFESLRQRQNQIVVSQSVSTFGDLIYNQYFLPITAVNHSDNEYILINTRSNQREEFANLGYIQ